MRAVSPVRIKTLMLLNSIYLKRNVLPANPTWLSLLNDHLPKSYLNISGLHNLMNAPTHTWSARQCWACTWCMRLCQFLLLRFWGCVCCLDFIPGNSCQASILPFRLNTNSSVCGPAMPHDALTAAPHVRHALHKGTNGTIGNGFVINWLGYVWLRS